MGTETGEGAAGSAAQPRCPARRKAGGAWLRADRRGAPAAPIDLRRAGTGGGKPIKKSPAGGQNADPWGSPERGLIAEDIEVDVGTGIFVEFLLGVGLERADDAQGADGLGEVDLIVIGAGKERFAEFL